MLQEETSWALVAIIITHLSGESFVIYSRLEKIEIDRKGPIWHPVQELIPR